MPVPLPPASVPDVLPAGVYSVAAAPAGYVRYAVRNDAGVVIRFCDVAVDYAGPEIVGELEAWRLASATPAPPRRSHLTLIA